VRWPPAWESVSASKVLVQSQSRERESAGSQLRVAVAEAGDSSGTQRKGNATQLEAATKNVSEVRHCAH
jgi:hypothetical protein